MKRSKQLVISANRRLARLGGTVDAGHFVCPLCLRMRPVHHATEGHYPARTAPASRRRTELQCADCNSLIGGTYESFGVDFLRFVRTVTFARPDGSGPMMERRARVRNTEEAVSISIDTGRGRRRSRRAGQTSAQLEHILSGVAAPKALNVRLSRPSDEVAKRALLAWSYLALFYYAGYEYAASMGAYEVRRLILDPASELPETVMYTKGTATLPLEAPQPALIARFQEGLAAPVEVIALGVAWGPIVAVFPFANDIDDRPWRRVRELIEFDQLRSTAAVRMRQMYEPFEKELLGQVRITGSDGSDWTVTARLTELEVRALAAGVSARRIDPAFKGTWKPAMVVEHDLLVREGEPPA